MGASPVDLHYKSAIYIGKNFTHFLRRFLDCGHHDLILDIDDQRQVVHHHQPFFTAFLLQGLHSLIQLGNMVLRQNDVARGQPI